MCMAKLRHPITSISPMRGSQILNEMIGNHNTAGTSASVAQDRWLTTKYWRHSYDAGSAGIERKARLAILGNVKHSQVGVRT